MPSVTSRYFLMHGGTPDRICLVVVEHKAMEMSRISVVLKGVA